MIASLERPVVPAPSPQQVLADFGPIYAANGFIGFVFAATGPVAIILSVGISGGLSPAELASWIFGVFFINGLSTTASRAGMVRRSAEVSCAARTSLEALGQGHGEPPAHGGD